MANRVTAVSAGTLEEDHGRPVLNRH